MRPDELELAAHKPAQHFLLRANDLPQLQHLFFYLQNRVERLLAGIGQRALLHLRHLHRQLVQRRLVVLDDQVQQRVGHAVRLRGDVRRVAQAHLRRQLHRPQRLAVKRHQEILAQVKTQFRRREHPVLPAVVHRVDHHEQVRRKGILLLRQILLHLRRRTLRHAVLDGQGMKMEDVFEEKIGLLRSRILEVNPQEQIGVHQQRRHQEQIDVLAVQSALGRKCE